MRGDPKLDPKALDPNYLNKHYLTITRYIIIIAVHIILLYQNNSLGLGRVKNIIIIM